MSKHESDVDILQKILADLPIDWDGRRAICEMKGREFQWRQMEWAGFYSIIRKLNSELGTTILLVEQNARMALSVAGYGYVMEQGKVVLDGAVKELRENEDIKEFYLGAGKGRKSFKDIKSYKRRKRWL